MRLVCVQPDIVWEDKPANYARIEALLDQSPPPAGSLVLLPEMFATGFSMNVALIGEDPDGPTERFLAGLAQRRGIYAVAGVAGRGLRGRGRNEAVVFSPEGRLVARYAKLRTFTPGTETTHYERGAEVVLFDWGGCSVAPFICYDLRFPELFRRTVVRGAQVYAVMANWPAPRIDHWFALLRARAIENQAYVAGVNRCGQDPSLAYCGRSAIFGPRGERLAEAGDAPAVIGCEIDLAELVEYRRDFPVLDDLRTEGVD